MLSACCSIINCKKLKGKNPGIFIKEEFNKYHMVQKNFLLWMSSGNGML